MSDWIIKIDRADRHLGHIELHVWWYGDSSSKEYLCEITTRARETILSQLHFPSLEAAMKAADSAAHQFASQILEDLSPSAPAPAPAAAPVDWAAFWKGYARNKIIRCLYRRINDWNTSGCISGDTLLPKDGVVLLLRELRDEGLVSTDTEHQTGPEDTFILSEKGSAYWSALDE
jgi:hypothetical protein